VIEHFPATCFESCSGSSGWCWRRCLCSGRWSSWDPSKSSGWKLAGTLVPLAYIGWSVWLLALGIGLLLTA